MNAGETQLMACGARGQSWGPYWNSTMPMVGLRCTGGYAKLREGPLHTFPIVYITTNNSAAVFQYAHARSARRSAYIICVDSVTCVPPRSNLRICLVASSGPPRVGCPSSRACHLLTQPISPTRLYRPCWSHGISIQDMLMLARQMTLIMHAAVCFPSPLSLSSCLEHLAFLPLLLPHPIASCLQQAPSHFPPLLC